MMTTIYIGIGSNLEDPCRQVRQAINELQQLRGCEFIAASSLYKSQPLVANQPSISDQSPQPDYINAVVALETDREPLSLLDDLQALEAQHGRVRTSERWQPRTLDLDVLLVGDKIINHSRLIIPHPGLHERSFVLYPLQEIAPDLVIPGYGPLTGLVAQCDDEGLERLGNT
jgi:2-amino-4-hydroxy-6-hydroxymethyldihydropteridine diphosphokinase